jgi:hypothetical protein
VRNLHQDTRAVAGARIGADRAAMLEVAENAERVADDLVRLLALDIGDETDAAGILLQGGVVKTYRWRSPGVLAGFTQSFGRLCPGVFALELRPAHLLSPLNKAKRLTAMVGAPWAFAAGTTRPPLVLREPRFLKFRLRRPTSPTNGLACHLFGA